MNIWLEKLSKNGLKYPTEQLAAKWKTCRVGEGGYAFVGAIAMDRERIIITAKTTATSEMEGKGIDLFIRFSLLVSIKRVESGSPALFFHSDGTF